QERELHLADDAQRRQGSLLAERGGREVRLRELWTLAARWYAAHSMRDRRILAGIGALAALSLLYVGLVQPLIHYRKRVKTEIEEGQDQLEHAARFLAVASALRAERDDLRQRVAQAKDRLLPGSSGTLGAAALQERANSLAAEKGITVQSTQVMKEEPVEPFHKIAIRLTLSGELKPFAELVSGLEYGPQQLSIPFVELSRRGAVAGAKGPRTLQATVEVSGYLQGEQAAKAEAEPAEGEGEAPAGTAEDEAGALANQPPARLVTAIAAKDLSAPSRRPPSVEDTTTAAVPVTKPPDNVSVVGVRIFGKDREAFVSDGTQGQAITRRVRTGDQIAGYIVKAIERTAVTLTSPSGDVVSMPLTLDAGKAQPSGPRQATPVRQPIPGRPPQPAAAQAGSPAAGVQGPSPAAGLGGRPPVPVAPQPAVGAPPKP